jgi:lactoylglutathione lyase
VSFSVAHLNVINLFADDLDRTKAFYREVLGLTLVFEDASHNVFKLENLIINLIDLRAAHDLVSPAPVADSNSGTRAVLSVFVDDVDAVCAELADRGVGLINGPLDRPWGVRTASFSDPAGHIWEVGQSLD